MARWRWPSNRERVRLGLGLVLAALAVGSLVWAKGLPPGGLTWAGLGEGGVLQVSAAARADAGLVREALQQLGLAGRFPENLVQAYQETGDVTPARGEETIVVLSAAPHVGAIAVFDPSRKLVGRITDLGDIGSVSLIRLPGLKQQALVVQEHADQMLGAYTVTDWLRIYVWRKDAFAEVWKGVRSSRSFINEAWQGVTRDPGWVRVAVDAEITFEQHDRDFRINVDSREVKARTTGQAVPQPERRWTTISTRRSQQSWIWQKGAFKLVSEATD